MMGDTTATGNGTPTAAEIWESRYGGDDFLYGTEPNGFMADGEGRNGVHLASLDHRVTSVDLTEAGMAKAARLAVRRRVHGALATALRPGGRFVLEAYTPDQIGRGTGGPPVPELTMTLDGLREELTGLEIEFGWRRSARSSRDRATPATVPSSR